MNTDIKQAMHVEAGKSFGTSEANENERQRFYRYTIFMLE